MIIVTPQLIKTFLSLFQYLPIIGKYVYSCCFLPTFVELFPWEFPGREITRKKIGYMCTQYFLFVVILPL